MAAVTGRMRNCCNQCAHSKIRCDSTRPTCLNCRRRDRSCTYSYVRQSGRPRRIRSAHGDGQDPGSVGRTREHAAPITTGQQCHLSTGDAPPLSPDMTLANSELQAFLDGDFSLHADPDRLASTRADSLAPGNVGLDFLESLDIPSLQHSMSTESFDLSTMEADFSMNTTLGIRDPACNQDTCTSIEPSLTTSDLSTRSSSPPTGSSQLESGLQGLLDDSRISSIVDSMMDSPLQDGHFACVTESRRQNLHSTARGGSNQEKACRCHAMLSKLYLVVMDPKLSQTTRLLPLDLVLFLEQALQDSAEMMKRCTVCRSSGISSANGITLCIAANWIVNTLHAVVESELSMFATGASSNGLWGACQEPDPMEASVSTEQHNERSVDLAAVPPSMDVRNCLRIGTWSTSSETWALCVSATLARRIKRMQRMLSTVSRGSAEVAETAGRSSTVKAEHEMAKDTCAKADVLLGMVETLRVI